MRIQNCRYSIFIWLQKEQELYNKQKISLILSENAFEAVNPYSGPQNFTFFDCTFFEHQYCIMWPLINETRYQVDKNKKKAKLSNTCFFRENLFPKTWKALKTKWIN